MRRAVGVNRRELRKLFSRASNIALIAFENVDSLVLRAGNIGLRKVLGRPMTIKLVFELDTPPSSSMAFDFHCASLEDGLRGPDQ